MLPAPGFSMASGIYRIFCMPASSEPSKAAKMAGIRVTSPDSAGRCQSSTYLMFSASRFQAAHRAVTQRSLDAPTRALSCSTTRPSPEPTGLRLAISDAPDPTSDSILERYSTPLMELDHGGQKASFSHDSPLLGDGGGGLLASKLNLGSRNAVGVSESPMAPPAEAGELGDRGKGEKRSEISSGGSSIKKV